MSTSSSPFVLLVADLVRDHGKRRSESIDVTVDWGVELSRVEGPLHADLMLEGIAGGVVVEGDVTTEVAHRCHRCLTEWGEPLVRSFRAVAGSDAEYALDGPMLDTEPILRDEVLLSIPLLPVCREECPGLCSLCGADLNSGACPGHEDTAESPFAVLRDLLDR